MEHFNTDIKKIRYEVIKEVAKQAFAGNLDEKKDEIPYTIIPGIKPQFRCCVYKEREIIRERVRLAMGKPAAAGDPSKNIVQVMLSACEGCPITRFLVTENCQKCMAKKCLTACKFGAISMGRDKAYIDPDLCKECGKCVDSCPYHAIADLIRPCKRSCPTKAITMDENRLAKIDESKCINCGSCVLECPFGAISDISFLVDVIDLIKSDQKVFAIPAPAIEGQFGADVNVGMIGEALKELGFDGMVEVSLGADYVAENEAMELLHNFKEGKKMTTSCCPAFVNLIRKHYPTLQGNMSTTISPMAATARFIKAEHPGAKVVFFGPCIAKKSEIINDAFLEAADFAMTFEELQAMFDAKDIDVTKFTSKQQEGSIYGKRFSESGGVTASVLEVLKERDQEIDVKVRRCNGAAECKKALLMLKNNKLAEDFIEGMNCVGGCMKGPGMINTDRSAELARAKQLETVDTRGIVENLSKYEEVGVDMIR